MSYATKNQRLLTIMYSCILALPLFLILSGQSAANATDLDYTINVNSSLNVTMSASDISLALNPASTAFSHQDLSVTVGTNNDAGYNLMVTATGTDLNPTDPKNTDVIETLPALAGDFVNGYTPDNFPANYWGYKKSINGGSATNYLPFESSLELRNTDTKSNSDTTTITFGAKIDYTKPADTYTLALNFVVTANYTGPSSITDLTYLQDFAALDSSQKATILSTMTANTNYKLKDKRDEQDYTIARLTGTVANSNYSQVWMTKNLNLAGGTALNSTTTDMPDNYTIPTTYNNTSTGFKAGNTLPASSTSGFSSDTTAYVYNSGRTTCSSSSSTGSCYSYYSWTTATLGSGLSESGDGTDVTTASICPKGWRLPTSGNQTSGSANSWKKGDFYKLATAYGANLESNYYQNSGTFYNNAGPSTTVPNFLLAGLYYSGSFLNGASYGYYWSSSSGSSTNAYLLDFNSGYVDSADNNTRRLGFSVRCVLAE